MAACVVCGNEDDKAFRVVAADGVEYVFTALSARSTASLRRASTCACRIVGHGIETNDGRMFCCAHCAHGVGVRGARDRVDLTKGSV